MEEKCPQSRIVKKEFKGTVQCRVVLFNIEKIFFNETEWIHF
jgi:hypothetical protein